MSSIQPIAQLTYPKGPQQLLQEVSERLALEEPAVNDIRQLQASIGNADAWDESIEDVEAIVREFSETKETPRPQVAVPDAIDSAGETRTEVSSGDEQKHEQEESGRGAGTKTDKKETQTADVRSPDEFPEREKIDDSRVKVLRALTKKRGRELGLGEDAGQTIEIHILQDLGISEIRDVRVDELKLYSDTVAAYQMPE